MFALNGFLRRVLRLVLLCVPLLAGRAEAGPLVLEPVMDGVATTPHLMLLEDPERSLTPDAVASRPWRERFAPVEEGRTAVGVSASAWWVRLEVHNPGPAPVAWVAEFTYALTDYIDGYRRRADGSFEHLASGDHRPSALQAPEVEGFTLGFETPPGAREEIYFRLAFENSGALDVHHLIWTAQALGNHRQLLSVLYGLILGVAGAMLLYNLVIFLSFRAPEYGWYLLYILSAITLFLAQNGLGARYLWSDWPVLIDALPVLAAQALFLFGVLFTRRFLDTRDHLPQVDRLLLGLIAVDALSLLLFLAGQRAAAIHLVFVQGLAFALFPLIGVVLWRRGHVVARSYTLAWSLVTLVTALSILRLLGWVPGHPALVWVVRGGYVGETVLLALALADRIRLLKSQKDAAEQAQRSTRERMLAQLEHEVQARTAELLEAQRIADRLARTDPLTGLPNRRAFFEQAERELARVGRYRYPVAVVMLDIDHFKSINDSFGHAVGDTVIRHVGQVIAAVLRDADLVARIGGEEFALLLPQTAESGAIVLAERLRAGIAAQPLTLEDGSVRVTVSLGVAAHEGEAVSVDALLALADQALYAAKRAGRNRVVGNGQDLEHRTKN